MKQSIFTAMRPLKGSARVPGDKSISHRAVLFAAMAQGTSQLTGVLDSADVRSTMAAVSALGARVELAVSARSGNLDGAVTGWGQAGPQSPAGPIDCGNSGTTARLLAGVLAGWPVRVTLIGDESLSHRPMARVTGPLEDMGATFETTDGHLPLIVQGTDSATAVLYDSPVASAQVKSAVLLAGLRASGRTTVREPALSRDHTERLLPVFGVPVGADIPTHAAWVDGPVTLRATTVPVGGDPSSAAFIVVAALLVPESEVVIEHVSLNPTRIGFLRVLERMGADVTITPDAGNSAEPGGSITARYTPGLQATTVSAREVPSLIDEVPVLAVLAASARGTTRFEGVGELRVKESDRLSAILQGLGALGVTASVDGDALLVTGNSGSPFPLPGARALFDSLGDHRLAMSWAVAGLAGAGESVIDGFEAVDVSYPGFYADMAALGAW